MQKSKNMGRQARYEGGNSKTAVPEAAQGDAQQGEEEDKILPDANGQDESVQYKTHEELPPAVVDIVVNKDR